MSYESIDPVILAWTERHALALFTSIEGMEDVTFRCVYVSGDKGESCQIWVEPPESNHVALHAAGVETRLDEKLKQDWRVPVTDLEHALEHALSTVEQWMAR